MHSTNANQRFRTWLAQNSLPALFAFGLELTYGWCVTPAQRDLVGRSTELAAIAEVIDPTREGMRCLLLEGEAGIGKTSLWLAARSAASAAGYGLLTCAPTEAETGLPYAALGDLLHAVPEEAIASLTDPLRTALEVALFRASSKQGATDQLAVSNAFLRVVRHLAADHPLLLALDDIQWIDTPSMLVLAFALHRLEHEPVQVLAALRLPSTSDAGSVLQKAMGPGRLERLEIGPLSLNDVDDLLLQRLDRPLLRPELDRVYAVSGGNPFFALEIGRFIVEHPTKVKAGEPIPVPYSLADAIKSRIKKLSPETRDILIALAALARPDMAVLERADPRARSALDAAFSAQLVERSQGRLRFTHPLLASVIYATADPTARRKWHARLADLVGDSEEKAQHLALSAMGPDPEIANALEEAARSANARGAPDAAAVLSQQAAELSPKELLQAIERRQILTAEYRMRAGDVPGARDLLQAILLSPPTGKKPAEALRLMGSLTLGGEDLAEAERLLTEALSLTDDPKAQAIIERDLIRVFNQRGRHQEAFDHSVRLTEIAARCNDASLMVLAQRFKALTERHLRRLSPEARAVAIAIADDRISVAMDYSPGGLHPLMDWAVLLKWSDDFIRARILFKRVLTLTEGRDESLRAPVFYHLAEIECWAGDWLLAAVYLHECEKSVIHTGHRAYARLTLNVSAMLHCYRGEYDAARASGQEALAISIAVGDDPHRHRALAILGSIELGSGNAVAANEYFESLRAGGYLQAYRGVVRSEGDEVEALIALGRLSDAEDVSAQVIGDGADLGDPWQRAIGARCSGLLSAAHGDLEASITEFNRSLAAHEELAMPLERGRTLLALGSALRRAKRKRAARDKLDEALGIFKSLGAASWIRRAESELSRIAPPAAGTSMLTPTEARVANLVASGRTNKEVAAEMFLSVKTIEANLSRVYNKLDVRSRSELAARVSSQR